MNINSSSIRSRWKRIGNGLRRISPLTVPRPATSLIVTPLAPHPSKQINESKAKPPVYRSEPPNAPVTTEEAMYITTEAEVAAARAQRFYYASSTGSTAYETDYVVREAEHGAADGSAASQADVLEPYARTPALQVAIPSNGDTRDRKTPGIRIPNDGLFVDLTDSEFPDEPRLLDPEHEEAFQQVGNMFHDWNDGNITVPIPTSIGHPSSVQATISPRSIYDIEKTFPPESRPGSPENVMHQQPPAYPGYVTTSPSEGIPMDCGVLPSQLHPPGHRASRRRIVPPQGPEQEEIGSGDGRAQVGWVVPFSIDSRPNNPQQDSRESSGGGYDITHDFETHEASSHTSTPSLSFGRDSHLQSPANPHYAVASSAPPQSDRPFHAYGWVEYFLPDESLYYVHQTYQVVTDVDLGDETLLDAVTTYLQDHNDNISPGQEFWLQNTGSPEGGFVPLRCFVDHSKQSVVFDSPHEASGDGEHNDARRGYANDRLNAKYRYWSFMEAHPAHTSLPLDSHQDAIDALNWASTDELLPPHRSIAAPFTREECQSLKALLQSFADPRGETSLRTRTVSKILLRVVCWRQSRFHPNEPRPVEADRSGFRKDFMPACNSTFILAIMVYACLATTITLCLSQTFTKIAGIGAILFLMSPVVSNIVAIIQSRFSVNKSPRRSDSD